MQKLFKMRTRALSPDPPGEGSYVLYWMRTAVRAHENPALDEAVHAANQLGLPVLVYHALSERYPYASDRHHTFILEGARDVAAQLKARGLSTAFHLERPGHRGPHLRTLGEAAALVVTEEMPITPLREWTRRLADTLDTPVWAVDTACVVPMRAIGKAYERAYTFRKAHTKAATPLTPWVDVEPTVRTTPWTLPFERVSWEVPIRDLVAACAIDHTVAPCPQTRGGSNAGYARWDAFRTGGLGRYARKRNDPTTDGTSRLSAYLHYGMVAPTRIAREALQTGGAGAEKYLDELLIWRELAYTWCLYNAVHEGLDALPTWARSSLLDHASDPRPVLDRDILQRGRTGERIWDLAQGSLRIHGELHNNVRMTWGKALLGWTAGPSEAIAALFDLNHRYALDGRDPASVGGLLWCVGLFDRAFPESAVTGAVRSRSLAAHARRLDLDRWAETVAAPLVPTRVAVVGAGPAGAMAARTLADHGVSVDVFDKARGAGGRTSTRRDEDRRFDHGAQYLTARDPALAYRVANAVEAGALAAWEGPFGTLGAEGFRPYSPEEPRYVGTPGMNALVKHLLADLEVQFGQRVTSLRQEADGWWVDTEQPHGPYDEVVVAVPAPQAVPLLDGHAFADRLAAVQVSPCWTALATAPATDITWSGVRVEGQPVGWIARNQTKPGRPEGEQWVLQATAEWSGSHIEESPEGVLAALVAAASELTGIELEGRAAHRWRYALVTEPVGEPCLRDDALGLTVCGDALLGGRVEAALQSGAAAAGRLLGHHTSPGDG